MKRSMIAVCLLLCSPSTVMACSEDHNAGWFDQQTLRWSGYGSGGEATQSDRVLVLSLMAGASGVLMLLGSVACAAMRAGGQTADFPSAPEVEVPLALPFDGPACEPFCVRAAPEYTTYGWSSSEIESAHAVQAPWAALNVDAFCSLD
jgi:hypothetical protein